MRFITDRKQVSGLGSGREGTHHHWQMMVSSILMVPLVPLFVFTFANALGGTYEEVIAHFSRPYPGYHHRADAGRRGLASDARGIGGD
jgi:succinate dehydrogenase / fumarate reductase membrane anchor subunit